MLRVSVEAHARRAAAGLFAGAIGLAALAAPAAAQTTLRMANWLPPSHPLVADVMRPYAERVAEATDGRVTIQILDAPLGRPGALRISAVNRRRRHHLRRPRLHARRFKTTVLAEVPFLGDSAEAVLRSASGHLRSRCSPQAGEQDERQVCSLSSPKPGPRLRRAAATSTEPSTKISGAKLRVGGGIASRRRRRARAVAVQGPSSRPTSCFLPRAASPTALCSPLRVGHLLQTCRAFLEQGSGSQGLYNTSFLRGV